MKNTVAALALAVCGTAFAAGQFDGVYQSPVNSNYFLSVHQNGTGMIITGYSNVAMSNVSISYAGGGTFRPEVVDFFDLFSGSINGASAVVSGNYAFRACQVTVNITFTATQATANYVSVVNTPVATAQGFNCAALFPVTTLVFPKIY